MPHLRVMALCAGLVAACAAAPQPIDLDLDSGFAIYRSGRLSPGQIETLCRAGVEEMLVLDGTAAERECRFRQTRCPQLRVRYDVEQDVREPLSESFLRAFDGWIAEARASGKKVALRCRHGWHRAGRLAAYYQMKYQGLGPEEAAAVMNREGRWMWRFRFLDDQVKALHDYIADRGCTLAEEHCVRAASTARAPALSDDACPTGGNAAPQ